MHPEELYHTYRGVMYAAAYDVLRDAGLAEDAVHTAFVRILSRRYRPDAESEQRIRGFCVLVARCAALDIYRRRARQAECYPDNAIDLPVPDNAPAALELRDALARLPDEDRQLVMLTCLYGLSAAEAGHYLGLGPAAARKRLERARKRLKACMEEV